MKTHGVDATDMTGTLQGKQEEFRLVKQDIIPREPCNVMAEDIGSGLGIDDFVAFCQIPDYGPDVLLLCSTFYFGHGRPYN